MREMTVDLFLKHEDLICDVANKMARKLNFPDIEELISFGRSELIKKAPKWNPERGAFSTFATWVLRNAMLDYVERNRKLVPCTSMPTSTRATDGERSTQDWIEQIPDGRTPDSLPSRLSDLLKGCSEGAQTVIHVCLTTDVGCVFGKRPALERVRKMLIKQGWTRRQTHHAFAEIHSLIAAW